MQMTMSSSNIWGEAPAEVLPVNREVSDVWTI